MILISHGLSSANPTRLMISRPSPKRTPATMMAKTGWVGISAANSVTGSPEYVVHAGEWAGASDASTSASSVVPVGILAEARTARQLPAGPGTAAAGRRGIAA